MSNIISIRRNPRRRANCAHRDGLYHDCAYVDKVNRLVPLAAAAADVRQRNLDVAASFTRPHGAERNEEWSAFFHEEMGRLRRAEGLGSGVSS